MDVVTLEETYGDGGFMPDEPTGNVLSYVIAETDETGTWWVVTRDGAGNVVAVSPANPTQAATFAEQAQPVESVTFDTAAIASALADLPPDQLASIAAALGLSA